PNRDGRLANGVGLDTPTSLVDALRSMADRGYEIGDVPLDPVSMMQLLQTGPTNALDGRGRRTGGISGPLGDYQQAFDRLPNDRRNAVHGRWGSAAGDPHVAHGAFRLGLHRFGNLTVGIQPSRGYNIDPKSSYHDPDLVPPHHYLAFYLWLREVFGAHAVVH